MQVNTVGFIPEMPEILYLKRTKLYVSNIFLLFLLSLCGKNWNAGTGYFASD